MINHIHVQKFKCLRDITVTLEPLTVLVGPNDSGKTSLMMAIEDQDSSGDETTPRYRFHPDQLRSPCKPSSVPLLVSSGSNLADALHSLIIGPDPAIRGKIDSALHAEIPTLRSVFTPVDREGRLGLEYVLAGDAPGPVRIPSQQVSDGALLLTAFLTLAWQNTPGIVLIEEPENGLHPSRLQSVIALLRKMTTGEVGNRPRQVILTTHNPVLLNYVEPREVRVFRRNEAGETVVVPMSDVPDIDRLLKTFSPGEIWNLFGEEKMFEAVVS